MAIRSGTNLRRLTLCNATTIIAVMLQRGKPMSLKIRAQEKVERAGISNYSFDHDVLVMCGVRYTIAACDCGEADCDGVRLEKDAAIANRILQ
jgi:hypothetical protein